MQFIAPSAPALIDDVLGRVVDALVPPHHGLQASTRRTLLPGAYLRVSRGFRALVLGAFCRTVTLNALSIDAVDLDFVDWLRAGLGRPADYVKSVFLVVPRITSDDICARALFAMSYFLAERRFFPLLETAALLLGGPLFAGHAAALGAAIQTYPVDLIGIENGPPQDMFTLGFFLLSRYPRLSSMRIEKIDLHIPDDLYGLPLNPFIAITSLSLLATSFDHPSSAANLLHACPQLAHLEGTCDHRLPAILVEWVPPATLRTLSWYIMFPLDTSALVVAVRRLEARLHVLASVQFRVDGKDGEPADVWRRLFDAVPRTRTFHLWLERGLHLHDPVVLGLAARMAEVPWIRDLKRLVVESPDFGLSAAPARRSPAYLVLQAVCRPAGIEWEGREGCTRLDDGTNGVLPWYVAFCSKLQST
jgi:hypothetical protein